MTEYSPVPIFYHFMRHGEIQVENRIPRAFGAQVEFRPDVLRVARKKQSTARSRHDRRGGDGGVNGIRYSNNA